MRNSVWHPRDSCCKQGEVPFCKLPGGLGQISNMALNDWAFAICSRVCLGDGG